MSHPTRRNFLTAATTTVAAGTALDWAGAMNVKGANEKIVIGAIGLGGRGRGVAAGFAKQKDVEIAYVCDPDEGHLRRGAEAVRKAGKKAPKAVADMRDVLKDPVVDAVIVATPDHWHAPATILAVNAGKHVYVEKPCAHNIREGRLMVEAARKHKKIVQVGTQSRSSGPVIEAMTLLRDGAIGDVLVAKAWNSQRRANIKHAKPSKPPAGLNYDLWVGPAPFVPYQSNRLHYTWHWWYNFGTGDTGNDGVHDIDIARWGLGVDGHPAFASGNGGKFFFDDDQQFPDDLYVVFEYPGDGRVGRRQQLIFEQRIWSPYRQEGYENGNAFYGTKGMLLLGKNDGWKLFGRKNKLLKSHKPGEMGEPHFRNFLDCVRSGKLPNADVEIGHVSASLCHLGNIVARTGRSLRFDPKTERIVGDKEADALVRRTYREGHWAIPAGA
jgi:predicted dehydrogenase